MGATRRLLTIGHSYVVAGNRRLAHAIQRAAGGTWEVHVGAPDYFHGGRDLRPVRFTRPGPEPCPVTPLPARLTRFVHLFTYGRGVRDLLRSGWDVVHAWEEPYILAGAQLAAATPAGSRFVFRTAQSLDKWYPPPFSWFERYSLGRADGWICSGRTVAENLLGRPGYAGKPMARIPLGVDVGVFRPDPAAGAAVRRELGWAAGGPPVVGYLGRFVPEKGLGLLTRALEVVRAPWRALFVGGGPQEAELRAWAARFPDRVRVCTTVGHASVPRYLNAMDVLAAPSQTTPRWREQFGRMLVEAMACGVPVVGSDSGEIPFVLDGVGEVVGEADEAGWAKALGELIESPVRRADLADRGLAAAHDLYAWDEVGRQYLAFFERVLDARSPGSADPVAAGEPAGPYPVPVPR
jgi:glycosyltransferase involved in cell wall biosynthesis